MNIRPFVWWPGLLDQARRSGSNPLTNILPERIVWCYSWWQPANMEMLVTIPNIQFVKGIPMALEQDSYFSIFEDKMIVRKHHRIANQRKTKQNKTKKNRQLVCKRIAPSQPEGHLHRTELIPSAKRQSQHYFK